MDRRRPRAAALGAALALAAALAAAAPAEPPLRALRWTAPGADPVAALNREPPECLARPRDPEAALKVEIGRAAFRTPVLLGGQAARAGLSCEACHRAGRDNPDFRFPGVSGPPGTADVTSSLFSSRRGNGRDDPVAIPDLGGAKAALKVDQAPAGRALEAFIHGLVVEEFDGPEPAPAVLAGLAAYVRAMDPAACAGAPPTAVTPASLLADARRAAAAGEVLAARGDDPAARLMVAAARSRLGLIHERFVGPGLAGARERLLQSDARLGAVADALRTGDRRATGDLARWRADSLRLEADLARREAESLFDSNRLSEVFGRRLPP